MGKINVLSFEIANLIAAGEVVERPSSVLKELIENSIDSGATEIVAEIKRGGVSLIRVTDNGCGIEKEDLPVALKRHATSKIKDKDDLDSIMTLGFRGEALAAISSVSSMTIITKTRDADIGYMLTAEAGNVVDIAEVGASDGTTVVVNDLFYNVPARRKFLKKDSTEAMNVAALVEKVALSRPDVSIQLLVDGEERFKTPGDGKLYNTVYAIFGKAFATKLIEVNGVANGVRVHGYIGRSDNVKKNRNGMNVFINGRYVKCMTAQAAIERAYTSYIAPNCYPSCILFIEINPTQVDVNVHPAKLEVKFSDERPVFETVYHSVKTALEEKEYRPEMELSRAKVRDNPLQAFVPIGADTKGEQLDISIKATPYIKEPQRSERSSVGSSYGNAPDTASVGRGREIDLDKPMRLASAPARGLTRSGEAKLAETGSLTPKDSLELLNMYRDSVAAPRASIDTETRETVEVPKSDTAIEIPMHSDVKVPEYKFVGEAFDCYVMIEYEGALLIIDKHAAHERVIFEDLKRSREAEGRLSTQLLLLPVTVLLDAEELDCAREFKGELESVGFEYTLGQKSCDITVIPNSVSPTDAEALFVKMLDELVEGKGNPAVTDAIRREKALYQIACKSAIKGGRVYDRVVLDWLIGKVLSLPDITVCPHGRPIAYRLTKSELDRQFERIK